MRTSRKPDAATRGGAYLQASALTPPWGQRHLAAAFDGDPDAALSLAVALHDWQRPLMAALMYRARVPPAAFRVVLAEALTQTHEYKVVRAARGWRQFVSWCGYAEFPIPDYLPEEVTIFRGVNGPTRIDAIYIAKLGVSWTLDRELAAWFAWRFCAAKKHLPIVAATKVPRTSILFFDDGRGEKEVIPEDQPVTTPVVFWEDQSEIRAAYERVRERMDRDRRQMFARSRQDREGAGERDVRAVRKQLISILQRRAGKGTAEGG